MGALATKALRPIKTFNIENRVHRVISKEKPTAAPMYPQNVEDLKRTLEEVPDIDEKLDTKDQALDERLKEVYVTSVGRPEDDITRELKLKKEQNKLKPLPQDKSSLPFYELGFKEPDEMKFGYTTIRHVLNFLSASQVNPEEITAARIAHEYKLKEEDVEDVLKYYKTFEVFVPETKTSAAVFAGPGTMRQQLLKQNSEAIEGKQNTVTEKDKNVMKDTS